MKSIRFIYEDSEPLCFLHHHHCFSFYLIQSGSDSFIIQKGDFPYLPHNRSDAESVLDNELHKGKRIVLNEVLLLPVISGAPGSTGFYTSSLSRGEFRCSEYKGIKRKGRIQVYEEYKNEG